MAAELLDPEPEGLVAEILARAEAEAEWIYPGERRDE